MKAIVLAAGLGTRIRPAARKTPKVMLCIAGRPVLEHNLLRLRDAGIKRVYINLHYMPQAIKNYFGNGSRFGLEIEYSYEKRLLGTAGGVKKIAKNFKKSFLVVYGDNFTNFNFKRLIDFHEKKGAAVSIALFNKKTNQNSGIAGSSVEIDKRSRIVNFAEGRNTTDLSNAGIYVLSPKVLRHIPSGKFFDFGYHLFPLLLRRKIDMYGCLTKGFVLGMDNINCYNRARKFTEGSL